MIILVYLLTVSLTQSAISINVTDNPNDDGSALIVEWDIPGFDVGVVDSNYQYILQRSMSITGLFEDITAITDSSGFKVDGNLDDKAGYYYRLKIVGPTGESYSHIEGPFSPEQNWYHTGRTNVLVSVLITGLLVGIFIMYGKRGGKLYMRPIAGLEAVDEAIGRATEMGKPILYSAGRGSMQRPATIASMNILSSVAERVAEFNIPLIFPNNDPVTMAVAQEVAYEGFARAGHPDNFNPDNIFFVTDSQFGYAAAVDGIILRQRPATNLFFGTFEAESLILAETGNSIGAIQIAGTDSSIQMSFFIVACDYVLIGEELFAASGYLSQDAQVLGSIKGSDYLKVIIILALIIGVILAIAGSNVFQELLTIT